MRLQKAYDLRAEERESQLKDLWKVRERQRFLRYLRNQTCGTLLEIGAGVGHDSKFFADQGFAVIATDASAAMVQWCRAKHLTAYQKDFFALDFAPESFDAVWALNCLLHVPKVDFALVLEGIHAVLNRGGLFYLGSYGGQDSEGIWEADQYDPPRFFSFYTDDAIQRAVRPWFTIRTFKALDYGDPVLHFQAMILQKQA